MGKPWSQEKLSDLRERLERAIPCMVKDDIRRDQCDHYETCLMCEAQFRRLYTVTIRRNNEIPDKDDED